VPNGQAIVSAAEEIKAKYFKVLSGKQFSVLCMSYNSYPERIKNNAEGQHHGRQNRHKKVTEKPT
jgi:hypothetical protein